MALIDNLISYWAMEGDSTDSVGSNDGVDTTVVYNSANGRVDLGAYFSAGPYRINMPDTGFPSGADNLSINFWYKGTGNQDTMFQYGTDASRQLVQLYLTATGKVQWTDGSAFLTAGLTSVNTGSWFMVTVTANGEDIKYYVNSGTDGTTTRSNPIVTLSGDCIIADGKTGSGIVGSIDEVGIWDRELTTDEITELYNNNAGLTYPFTGGAVETIQKSIIANSISI